MSRQLVSVASTLADRLGWRTGIGNTRGVILALASAAILLMTGYQFSYGFLAILLVSLVWGGVWAPTMALYDGVLVTETKARGFNYGSLRVWSSVAFILGAVICGAAVDRNGPAWVLYVGFAGIVLLVPLALLLPPAESHHRDAAQARAVRHPRPADLAAVPAVHDRHRLLPGEPRGALQLRHADLARRRHRRRHHQPVVGPERRRRDRADAVQRPAAGAARRLRHDRPGARLRHGALARHGLHDRLVGVGAAAGAACRQLRRLPSRRHGLHPARRCRPRAWRWARASTMRSARAPRRR